MLSNAGGDTGYVIDYLLENSADAALAVTDIHPIRFDGSEVHGQDGFSTVIVLAQAETNSVLDIRGRDYYLLRAVFSAGSPNSQKSTPATALDLEIRLDPEVTIRSFFPSTQAAALARETRTQNLTLKIGSEASLEAVVKQPGQDKGDPQASMGGDTGGSASVAAGLAWHTSYTLVGHPVVARRTENGASWRLTRTDKLADSESTALSIPLTGNDIGVFILFGVPKGVTHTTVRAKYRVEYGNVDSLPAELSVDVPLLR